MISRIICKIINHVQAREDFFNDSFVCCRCNKEIIKHSEITNKKDLSEVIKLLKRITKNEKENL